MSTKPPASALVSSRRLAAIRSSTASRSRWAFMSATTSPSRRTTRARCGHRGAWPRRPRRSRWHTFTQPSISPSRPVSALMSMRRSSRLPSLRARRVANEIWPPLRTRSSTALCSACSSSGMIGGSRPSTSAAVQPNIRSAAGFHSRTVRSVPNATIASAAHSITARAVASTRFCPVACCRPTTSWCHPGTFLARHSADAQRTRQPRMADPLASPRPPRTANTPPPQPPPRVPARCGVQDPQADNGPFSPGRPIASQRQWPQSLYVPRGPVAGRGPREPAGARGASHGHEILLAARTVWRRVPPARHPVRDHGGRLRQCHQHELGPPSPPPPTPRGQGSRSPWWSRRARAPPRSGGRCAATRPAGRTRTPRPPAVSCWPPRTRSRRSRAASCAR